MNASNSIHKYKYYKTYPQSKDLHDMSLERDSCGTGFIVSIHRTETRTLVEDAIKVLMSMEHRGAQGADPHTGDGVGILLSLSHQFFSRVASECGIILPDAGLYAVGNVFLPTDASHRKACKAQFEALANEEGLTILGWRTVPVNSTVIGDGARACEPITEQVFVSAQTDYAITQGADNYPQASDFDRVLYIVRKRASNGIRACEYDPDRMFYICSLSAQTIVYKGMLTTAQLDQYYDDLRADDMTAYLALVHSRFSTNTFPSWDKAQPLRMMSHNGEINTLCGNVNKMRSREGVMKSELFGDKLKSLYPIIEPDMSDSGSFDNCLEFLYKGGYPLPKTVCMMIPEAWQNDANMSVANRAMYETYSCAMEPWDGPACITFTDGRYVGAVVDRNGLRPNRYYVTSDGLVILASEFGVLDIAPERIVKKNRLRPGKVFFIDTTQHRIIDDKEVKSWLSSRHPYHVWGEENRIRMSDLPKHPVALLSHEEIERRSMAYGYTEEDKIMMIKPMIEKTTEPLGSMGNDVALACLSEKPRPLYDYFKQMFAQITNPPIDSIRERAVMSIGCYIGPESNLLVMSKEHCSRLWLEHPVLSYDEYASLVHIDYKGWKSKTIDITYLLKDGWQGLTAALQRICKEAEESVLAGYYLIVLSDQSMSKERIAISALMAVGAVHHYLIDKALRVRTGIIVDSGEPREVHHFCALIGYGADAIFPYAALRQAEIMHKQGVIVGDYTTDDLVARYKKATEYGICKVLAKMGVPTIDGYKGAQIFEIVGLSREVVDICFKETSSRIGGLGFKELFQESAMFHHHGYGQPSTQSLIGQNVINLGNFQWRKDGYKHMWDPESITLFQHAIRSNNQDVFNTYVAHQNQRTIHQATIRSILTFKQRDAIPIEEVEPVESIVKRFVTGAMSFGSISQQAHETIAIAMNRLGGRSNSGEGGESSDRYTPLPNGDFKRSAIKQVASGRFGVTIEYLANADVIQIKVAQGAKPGEGGELPGEKVFDEIARVRHSIPGIGLVSPPPHHDTYSVEDLKQLIFDLKNANPSAKISVKLVSKAGVGMVASAVAKGKADHILVSGHDGGTGAAQLTSIKHAGIPVEIGIAEAHQVLVHNNLRSRVILQSDGQLKTGRDLAILAMLGAEEFGFGTSALIALGCIMMRKCEKNTCPVGIATHDPRLTKTFTGKPEHVERMMRFIANDFRATMASLGFRSVTEMVGRTDILEPDTEVLNWKSRTLDIAPILGKEIGKEFNLNQYCSMPQNHEINNVLDKIIIQDVKKAIEEKQRVEKRYRIKNTNRSIGTMLSHEIVKRYALEGLPEDTINLHFDGHAGQSFGAFLSHGITLKLRGDANDYVGKGLSGGVLVLMPPGGRGFSADDSIIVGNVVLYGAIAGKAFIRGLAAERFCIRNSGVHVVVEGVGAYACEYMTGGRVVILGSVGKNFASGMSGGVVYIWNTDDSLRRNLYNPQAKCMSLISDDREELHALISEHYTRTGSLTAEKILDHWNREKFNFMKVLSTAYYNILEKQREINQLRIKESA